MFALVLVAGMISAFSAERSFSDDDILTGESISVSIDVDGTGTVAYGVDEFVPSGWTVSGINEGGSFDGTKVSWVTFDNNNRVLSYTATAPLTSGVYTFKGNYSDGSDTFTTSGQTQVTVESNGSQGENGSAIGDDLMVNYVRGKITFDGNPVTNGNYKLEVLDGENAGFILQGSVDQDVPSQYQNQGFFDTLDNVMFNTGDSFRVTSLDHESCSTQGTFENGGQGDFETELGLILLNCESANQAPELDPISNVEVNEGGSVSIDADATDPEGQTITYSLQTAPGWLSINSNNGFISGTAPNVASNTDFSVTVKAEDIHGASDTESFTIRVNNVNEAPKAGFPFIKGLPNNTVFVLEDSGFNEIGMLNATDSDGIIDRFEVVDEALDKVNCQITDSLFGVTPAENFAGTSTCDIKVYDDSNAFDEVTITIHVKNVNDAPEIIDKNPSTSFIAIIPEDGIYNYFIEWKDVDNTLAEVIVKWFTNGGSGEIGDDSGYTSEFTFTGNSSWGTFNNELEVKVKDLDNKTDTKNWNIITSSVPLVDKFNGSDTSNFSNITNDSQLEAYFPLILHNQWGKIEFLEPIDLRNVVDLNNYAAILKSVAGVDSKFYPQFKGKSAMITLYTPSVQGPNPTIYYTDDFTKTDIGNIDNICTESICTDKSFNDPELNWKVEEFNTFKAGSTLSCSELGGNICSTGYVCPGLSTEATDTNTCCLTTCQKIPPEFNDIDQCSVKNPELKVNIKEPDDGDSFDVGEEILVEVEIENDHSEDLDVELTVYLYDLEEDEVIEEIDDDVDVDEGDSEKLEFKFTYKDYKNVESENLAVFVKAEGKNGVDLCNQNFVEISLEREKHDLRILDVNAIPEEVSPGKGVEIIVEVENFGTKEQEDAYVIIGNSELGISEQSEFFDIEEFDKHNKEDVSIFLKIPENAEEKEYLFTATVVYDDEDEETSENFILNVGKAKPTGTGTGPNIITYPLITAEQESKTVTGGGDTTVVNKQTINIQGTPTTYFPQETVYLVNDGYEPVYTNQVYAYPQTPRKNLSYWIDKCGTEIMIVIILLIAIIIELILIAAFGRRRR